MDERPADIEPLPASFYARDTVTVARELLGAVVVSRVAGRVTSGRIVETEAYLGTHDPGSHAATKRITKRNSVLYGPPGRAYVYFTYGNHHMLNVVTEPEGTAGAVLIRAIEPLDGVGTMLARRAAGRSPDSGRVRPQDLANGPGKLACALGLTLADNGVALDGTATLAVFPAPARVGEIATTGRIGLTAGHELPLRFFIEGDPHVSSAKPGARRPSQARTGRSIAT